MNNMIRLIVLGISIHAIWGQFPLLAQRKDSATKKYTLPQEVNVTGSRIADDGKNPRRTLIVVQRMDIERSQARSVEEVLRNVAGVDVRQRGALGVQADISIRGGTFEQTLIMIDGVKMIDPQTGHHAMNIPLTLDDIERIEVLKGPGSRQYGPNAFNGAINIITRRHTRPSARIQAMGGENGLWEMSLSGGAPLAIDDKTTLLNRASIMRRRSNSFRSSGDTLRSGTDFDIWTVAGGAQLLVGDNFSLDMSLNYTDKKFGGNGFYALTFPTQYEETKTIFANLTANINLGVPVRITAAWRRNNDYFILRRENPAFYQNFHTSNTVSIEAQTTLQSSIGATAVGAEYAADMLESTNLNNRQRSRFSIFAEHQIKPIENLTLEIGATALFNSDWGWNLAPGADIGWQVTESLCLRGSVAQSFRIPSYTELFYNDRITRDNPNVQPERAWTFELGGRWREGIVDVQASVFRRSAVQLIDYVRNSTDATGRWQAQNLSSAITNGADVHVSLITRDAMPILERLTASYTYLDPVLQVDPGLQSRYVLDQLRHQAALILDLRLFGAITNQWRFRYERRLSANQDAGFVDIRLGWSGGGFEVFAEATNLLNAAASDFNGLPLPGRWLRLGGAVNLAEILR